LDHIWMYIMLGVIVLILIVFGLYVGYRVHMHRQYLKKEKTDRELYRQILDHLHRRLGVSEAAQQFGLEQYVSILHTVRKFTRFPLTENDRIKLLENGEEKFPELIRMIKEAKHHLHLLYFIMSDDYIGMEILSLLEEKVKEGVEVRLLIDGVGSFRFHRSQTYSRCRRAGIKCGVFSPAKPAYWWSLNARNHRKIVVADGRVGMTGGLNIGDEYLHRDPQKGFWRDIQVLVEGEAVLLLQNIFATDWYYATGIKIAEDDRYFPQYSAEGTHRLHDRAEEQPQAESITAETNTERYSGASETLAGQESTASDVHTDSDRRLAIGRRIRPGLDIAARDKGIPTAPRRDRAP
jgi:cardiolipin synthase A/B